MVPSRVEDKEAVMSRTSRIRRSSTRVVGALALAALALGPASPVAAAASSGAARTATGTNGGFVRVVDNPYYPLPPGTTDIYKGVRDGRSQVDRVTVLHRTKQIQGITATVVRDVARHQSQLIEKTFDWFAQDVDGNVWYLGENTKEYDKQGHVVSTEGSWEDGVDGATRGIIMEANPRVPDAYRQEFYPGHAEDTAWVVSRGTSLTVPYGRVDNVLRTIEFTQLEPKVVDEKYYAPGIGIVYEVSVAGGQEVAKLVRVTH
jgi:hypothetical protein